jgi:HlyD family secretion protein
MTPELHPAGRIARQDDLHLLMTVVNAKDWILVLAIALLLAMAGIWSVSGRVRTTVGGYGVLVQESPGSDLACSLYIPAQEGEAVRPGMAAQIIPDGADRSRYGGVVASVTSLSRAVGEPRLRKTTWVKVTARLQPDSATPSGYRWTSGFGPHLRLRPGTTTFARVFIGQRAPITYLLAWFKDKDKAQR